MDRDSLLDRAKDVNNSVNATVIPTKRRTVIRKKQPKVEIKEEKDDGNLAEIMKDVDSMKKPDITIEEIMNQVSSILAEEMKDPTPISNDAKSWQEMEMTIAKIVMRNSNGKYTNTNAQTDHIQDCDGSICQVEHISVYSYPGHICVRLRGHMICDDPYNKELHQATCKKDETNYFLCMKTGLVHMCGDNCRASKNIANEQGRGEGYVCPISGRFLGVEMVGEWWTDPSKKMDDLFAERIEVDEAQMELINPRTITIKKYDEHGVLQEVSEHRHKNIFVTHHLHYHSHPFEKNYYYYILRCKKILWLMIYSNTRHQIERKRSLSAYENLEKTIEKYVRGQQKNGQMISYHVIRSYIRINMKQRFDVSIWIPPVKIMDMLLLHYCKIVVKFFWIILEKTKEGNKSHTHLPFDYFALATVYLMAGSGLIVKGVEILPHDNFLATHLPDAPTTAYLGARSKFMTRSRNQISKAISCEEPKDLIVKVTPQDHILFNSSGEKLNLEQKDKHRNDMMNGKITHKRSRNGTKKETKQSRKKKK